MSRLVLALIGALLLAGVAIVVIPVPQTALDFSQTKSADGTGGAGRHTPTAAFRSARWDELMPKDWDPNLQVRELQKDARMVWDSDPRAAELLKRMRDVWNNAPVNPAMEGAAVRIPGYVVPLERSRHGLEEFLLVPYFGACIHSPPPPSNQVIHVVPREPAADVRSMDAVWIGGTLKIGRSGSVMGFSGYRMDAAVVEPYVGTRKE